MAQTRSKRSTSAEPAVFEFVTESGERLVDLPPARYSAVVGPLLTSLLDLHRRQACQRTREEHA